MSCFDLHLQSFDLELLQQIGCYAIKLSTNSERNRAIHRWVIDELARFRSAILWVGHDWQTVLRGARTQLHQTWREYRAIIPTQEMCFIVPISCCILDASGLKLSDIEYDAFFRTFWPPMKIMDGVSEISRLCSNCWSFTYERTSEIHLMAIHSAAAERGRLIQKRKESSSVKHKFFPTNVGRPNNSVKDCSIPLKFRTEFDNVTLYVSRNFKVSESKVKVTAWNKYISIKNAIIWAPISPRSNLVKIVSEPSATCYTAFTVIMSSQQSGKGLE